MRIVPWHLKANLLGTLNLRWKKLWCQYGCSVRIYVERKGDCNKLKKDEVWQYLKPVFLNNSCLHYKKKYTVKHLLCLVCGKYFSSCKSGTWSKCLLLQRLLLNLKAAREHLVTHLHDLFMCSHFGLGKLCDCTNFVGFHGFRTFIKKYCWLWVWAAIHSILCLNKCVRIYNSPKLCCCCCCLFLLWNLL